MLGSLARHLRGPSTNDRPVVVQQTDNQIRIGGQHGQSLGSTQTPPQDTRTGPQTEVGPSQDMFAVYEGHVEGSFEQRPPVWQYVTKDALRSPDVPAVPAFRKIVEEAERQQKTKP